MTIGGNLFTHAVALIVKESVGRAGGDHEAVKWTQSPGWLCINCC